VRVCSEFPALESARQDIYRILNISERLRDSSLVFLKLAFGKPVGYPETIPDPEHIDLILEKRRWRRASSDGMRAIKGSQGESKIVFEN